MTDPLLNLEEAESYGELGALEAFAENPELDPQGLTGGSEQGQLLGELEPDPNDPPPPVAYLSREYVWGPGDGPGSGAGVYELLVIFDEDRDPWWTVQDAGQDLVALIDAGATTPGGSTGGPGVGGGFGDGTATAARIVGEFSYTAYGELLTAASHAPHPDPHLGHKGLFLDRLDTGVVDPLSGAEVARHVLGAKHTYYMVNRSYDPQLGRFLQRDPNATGLPVVDLFAYGGMAITLGEPPFDLSTHIGDGASIYNYVDCSPHMRSDPTGLWFSIAFQLATMGVQGYLGAQGTLAEAAAGLRTAFSLDSLIDNYAMDQVMDAEWASDWDQPDEAYSKSAAFDIESKYGINTNIDGPIFAQSSWRTLRQTKIRIKGVTSAASTVKRYKVESGTYYVRKFKHPSHGKSYVVFSRSATKQKVQITPRGSSEADIAAANAAHGKSARYDWSKEYGVPHTWHHDHVRGRMYLVPTDLHKAVGHVGGMHTWY